MSSARTALRERVAALAQARRALDAGRLGDAERVLREELSRWPGNRDAQTLLAEVTRRQGGTPGRVAPVAAPAPSPVTGGPEAWSSFEARVRDRKVARLGERARAAIRSGALTEARALCDEIAAIAPGHPVLEQLSVQPAPAPEAPAPAPDPTRWHDEPLGDPPLREPATPAYTVGAEDLRIDGSNALDVSLRPLDLHEIDPPPATIIDRGSEPRLQSAPIRERGTFALGILLLAASVLALSGVVGYWWFTPTSGGAPAIERTARDTSTAPATTDRESGAPAHAPLGTTPQVPEQGHPSPSTSNTGRPDPGAPTSEAPAAPAQPRSSSATAAPVTPAAPTPTPVDPPPTIGRTEAARESNARGSSEPAGDRTAPPPAARIDPPRPELPGTSEPQAPPIAPPPTSTAPPAVASPAPPASLPGSASDTSAPRPAAPETAAAPARPAESNAPDDTPPEDANAMRGLIEGYLAGYNNLDAGGVRSVWPAVDHRALARAFGQLASQRLVFSRCEVRGENDEGHGFCIGRATWRPRVGGGERDERRVWRFDFEQRNGRWAIDGVEIER